MIKLLKNIFKRPLNIGLVPEVIIGNNTLITSIRLHLRYIGKRSIILRLLLRLTTIINI